MIDAAARELPTVSLEDALRIVVVLAEKNDARYEAAAARWAARASIERRLSLAGARRVNALLEALPAAPEAVALRLREFCATGRQGPEGRSAADCGLAPVSWPGGADGSRVMKCA